MRILLKTGVSLSALSFLFPLTAAHAEDITMSLEAAGGISDDDSLDSANTSDLTIGGLGSFNFDGPVAFQVDGLVFDHRDNTVLGGALHLGGRTGGGTYLGLYGSLSDSGQGGGLQTMRAGAEIDRRLGDFRLSLVAGYEDIDEVTYLFSSVPTLKTFENFGNGGDVFSYTDIVFQPGGDGAAVSVGHRYTGGHHALAIDAGVPLTARLSFTGHARMGGGDYSAALLGLRFIFGSGNVTPGNLLQNRLIEDLFAPGNTRRVSTQVIAPPPPPDDEDDGCGSCGGYCEA